MGLWRGAKPLILASGSRVRHDLLVAAGIPVEVHPATIDERAMERDAAALTSDALAAHLARAKGAYVAQQFPDRLVVAADQTLACAGVIFHKPVDRTAARTQLVSLSARTHELHSAVAVFAERACVFEAGDTARLTMRDLSPGFVDRYLDEANESVLASVGGYQLEGIGIQLFTEIVGSYFTILGLPLLPLLNFLQSQEYLEA